jgi:hypothetical protein
MNYWIFKANPEIFDVDEHIRSGDYPTWWRVSRFKKEIQKDDTVFIWRTGVSRGIVAVAETTSGVWYREFDLSDPQFSDEYKVSIRIIKYFPVITSNFLRTIPGLGNLSTFHGYQSATNFRVTQEEGEILMHIIGRLP